MSEHISLLHELKGLANDNLKDTVIRKDSIEDMLLIFWLSLNTVMSSIDTLAWLHWSISDDLEN